MPHDSSTPTLRRPRNDPGQYDDLLDQWWAPRGAFAMLHWIAAARARLIPPATHPAAVLVDIACGGGLMGPYVGALGYRHLGLDLSHGSLQLAAGHGVAPLRADAHRLPLADASADVVVAGEVLEHVRDTHTVLAEAVRVLRPGGTLVLDTIANTWWARLVSISLAEAMPGGPPRGLHDGELFVDRTQLVRQCAELGVELTLIGLRPSVRDLVRWLARRRLDVEMVPTWTTSILFQGHGVKRGLV